MGTAAYLNVFGSIHKVLKVSRSSHRLPSHLLYRREETVRPAKSMQGKVWVEKVPLKECWEGTVQREVVQGFVMTHMSVHAQDLQTDGYDVGEIPEDESALMQSVLNDPEAKYNSADLNVAYKMKVDEYQKLCPYAEALEENWGKPPGVVSARANWCQTP